MENNYFDSLKQQNFKKGIKGETNDLNMSLLNDSSKNSSKSSKTSNLFSNPTNPFNFNQVQAKLNENFLPSHQMGSNNFPDLISPASFNNKMTSNLQFTSQTASSLLYSNLPFYQQQQSSKLTVSSNLSSNNLLNSLEFNPYLTAALQQSLILNQNVLQNNLIQQQQQQLLMMQNNPSNFSLENHLSKPEYINGIHQNLINFKKQNDTSSNENAFAQTDTNLLNSVHHLNQLTCLLKQNLEKQISNGDMNNRPLSSSMYYPIPQTNNDLNFKVNSNINPFFDPKNISSFLNQPSQNHLLMYQNLFDANLKNQNLKTNTSDFFTKNDNYSLEKDLKTDISMKQKIPKKILNLKKNNKNNEFSSMHADHHQNNFILPSTSFIKNDSDQRNQQKNHNYNMSFQNELNKRNFGELEINIANDYTKDKIYTDEKKFSPDSSTMPLIDSTIIENEKQEIDLLKDSVKKLVNKLDNDQIKYELKKKAFIKSKNLDNFQKEEIQKPNEDESLIKFDNLLQVAKKDGNLEQNNFVNNFSSDEESSKTFGTNNKQKFQHKSPHHFTNTQSPIISSTKSSSSASTSPDNAQFHSLTNFNSTIETSEQSFINLENPNFIKDENIKINEKLDLQTKDSSNFKNIDQNYSFEPQKNVKADNQNESFYELKENDNLNSDSKVKDIFLNKEKQGSFDENSPNFLELISSKSFRPSLIIKKDVDLDRMSFDEDEEEEGKLIINETDSQDSFSENDCNGQDSKSQKLDSSFNFYSIFKKENSIFNQDNSYNKVYEQESSEKTQNISEINSFYDNSGENTELNLKKKLFKRQHQVDLDSSIKKVKNYPKTNSEETSIKLTKKRKEECGLSNQNPWTIRRSERIFLHEAFSNNSNPSSLNLILTNNQSQKQNDLNSCDSLDFKFKKDYLLIRKDKLSNLEDNQNEENENYLKQNKSFKLNPKFLDTPKRVLIQCDELLYAGLLTKHEFSDECFIVLDDTKCSKNNYVSNLENIIEETILEVKPTSIDQLYEGCRVCAFWSQKIKCLYPGRVTKLTSGSTSSLSSLNNKKELVFVEFDDGDKGRIELDEIRLLPQNFSLRNFDEEYKKDFIKPVLLDTSCCQSDLTDEVKNKNDFLIKDTQNSYKDMVLSSNLDNNLLKIRFNNSQILKKKKKKHSKSKKHHHHNHSEKKHHEKTKKKHHKSKSDVLESNHSNELIDEIDTEEDTEEDLARKEKEEDEWYERIQNPTKDSNSNKKFPKKNEDKKIKNNCVEVNKKSKIAAFLPERKLWHWHGEVIKKIGPKTRPRKTIYNAIIRGNEIIQVNDCAVFLSTGRPNLPFVGRIDSMWQNSVGNMIVRIKWFYHPEETKSRPKLLDSKGALFESDHFDDNDVQTISHKCLVLPYKDYINEKQKIKNNASDENSDEDDDPPNIYYYSGIYDPLKGLVSLDKNVPLKN